jgi:hypothetical protein
MLRMGRNRGSECPEFKYFCFRGGGAVLEGFARFPQANGWCLKRAPAFLFVVDAGDTHPSVSPKKKPSEEGRMVYYYA